MHIEPHLVLSGRCEEAVECYGRADGGAVMTPLDTASWSPRFGMAADRFGVSWMVSAKP